MKLATHTASRVILAPPRAIFRAFLDAEAMEKWRPPAGMVAKVTHFDPRSGGGYRMTLSHTAGGIGKTDATRDVVRVRFEDLVPDEMIVESVEFESPDPAFAGRMTVTTALRPVVDGTRVTFTAENVPSGISEEDHGKGMESTLKNLAALLE